MSKVVDLDSALRAAVRPGMTLHLSTDARAATRAIQRLFRGQQLELTLAMLRVGGGHAADLVASGLVRRVIAGSFGAVSRHHTGPLRQINAVHAAGQVAFQHWTFLSLTQRLVASAQGHPFIPTHSLRGSSMAAANAGDYVELESPFRGESVGLVRALEPDVSIIHALAADEEGNTLLVAPLEDGSWGPKASREGAIVTVERVVDEACLKQHANLVQLPARYVRAVCEVPFGAHPGRFGSAFLSDFPAYRGDDAFDAAYYGASRDPLALEAWLEQWVYGPRTHEAYLAQLGLERREGLTRGWSLQAGSEPSVERPTEDTHDPRPADETEWMMVLAAREVMRLARQSQHDLVLVGAGLSEVPGTVARALLRLEGHTLSLAAGHGYYDFEPVPGTFDPDPTTTSMVADPLEIYGVVLGGARGSAMALLGAAQVDRYGNLNSTLVGGRLLTGSGGSNDAASVCDTIVVIRHSSRKLVDEVEYITCPGTRVRAVVTERAVFRKDQGTGALTLAGLVVREGQTEQQALEELQRDCGWPMEIDPLPWRAATPSAEELHLVRTYLPDRYA